VARPRSSNNLPTASGARTMMQAKNNKVAAISTPYIEAVVSSGLDSDDLYLLMEVISLECRELGVSCTTTTDNDSLPSILVRPEPVESVPGALGRVLLFRASADMPQDVLEDLESGVCEQLDQLLSEEAISDSVLVSFQTDNDAVPSQEYKATEDDEKDDYKQYLAAIVANQVKEYDMMVPLKQIKEHAKKEETSFVPSMNVEIDGGYVSYPFDAPPFWDTSTLLIFDNLVDSSLRKGLLDVVLGVDSDEHDPQNGPDPSRWVRGGLLDVPDEELEESEGDDQDDSQVGGWGLTDESLQEICFEHHDAVQEMESILADLFPDFHVCRLQETVLGCSVTPMTANAPTAGDVFDYHIDADPNIAPSSAWTDVYGRYPNRALGKPRFMSCLVYLNEEWDGDKWGAPTRFVDVPTDEDLAVYTVQPRPGRCIIMDQDIGHSVVAPNTAAGKRPRYSVVWKLILHPKIVGQNMKNLAGGRESLWPETEYFGSAAQNLDGQSEKEPSSSLK
jgi:hypothetical protein